MASDMPDLTFIHISFAKIFCQDFVKKNCKFAFPVSIKTPIYGAGKGGKNIHPASRKRPVGSTENKKGSPKTALKNYNEIIVVDYFSLA